MNLGKNIPPPSLAQWSTVVDLIRSEVKKIDSTLWRNCIKRAIKVENTYVSPAVQKLIINIDCERSESEQFDSECND